MYFPVIPPNSVTWTLFLQKLCPFSKVTFIFENFERSQHKTINYYFQNKSLTCTPKPNFGKLYLELYMVIHSRLN